MAPEIALAHEFEAGRLDLAAQEAFLDAVERTPYCGARAGGGGMVRDHQIAAGLSVRPARTDPKSVSRPHPSVNPHSTRDQAFFYFGNTAKFEIGRSVASPTGAAGNSARLG
jgi:hypothetical protein